jgi:hypothetical protein
MKFSLTNNAYVVDNSSIPHLMNAFDDVSKKRERLIKRGRIPDTFPEIKLEITEIDKTLASAFDHFIDTPNRKRLFNETYQKHSVVKLSHGEAPILNNWKVLGMIEKNPETNSFTLTSFNEKTPVPVEYRDADPCKCDHCNTNRGRNSTFILKNEDDNELMQVGKSCMKDFVDDKELEMLIFYSQLEEVVRDFDPDSIGNSEGILNIYPKKEYLAAISCYMRHENGYRSYKNADFYDRAPHTSMVAKHMLNGADLASYVSNIKRNLFDDKEGLKVVDDYYDLVTSLKPTDDDYVRAEKTLTYFKDNPPEKTDNEFYYNMHSVITNDSIFLYKGESGRVSYAIEYYDQEIKRTLRDELMKNRKEKALSVPDFIGEDKTQFEEIEVKFTGFKESFDEDYYGNMVYNNIFFMETQDGRMLRWKASNSGRPECFSDEKAYPSEDSVKLAIKDAVDRGEPLWVTIKGNVSRLNEYNGVKKTFINRVKSLSELSTEPKTNGIPILLKEKYKTGEFKIESVESGTSIGSGKPQFKYYLSNKNEVKSFLLTYEKLKGLKAGDCFKGAYHSKNTQEHYVCEIFSIMPEKLIKIDGFDPDFKIESLTKLAASKFGVEKKPKAPRKKPTA